jgi:hypothetical protein
MVGKAQALGAEIQAAKDPALETPLCNDPVGVVNTKHPGVSITLLDVKRLLGIEGIPDQFVADTLRIRIHTPGPENLFGLMCACG